MPKNKAIRTKASFKAAAMGYVDAQLAIMKKYGSEPKVLSPAEYYGLVDEIMVVGMRLWENSGGLVKE